MRAVTCFGRWLGLAALGLAAAEVEWTDTPVLTSIWQATSSGETDRLIDMFVGTKDSAITRSGDGRGPLFWAYEFKNVDALALLMHFEADEDAEDADGKRPRDFFPDSAEMLQEFKAEADSRLEEVVGLLTDRQEEFAQYQTDSLDYGDDDYEEMEPDQRDEIDYADEEDEDEEPGYDARLEELRAKSREQKDEV